MSIEISDSSEARFAIEAGIEFLVDEDGYNREQIEEFLATTVKDLFEED
jgi:hypothetical protein